MSRIFTPHPSWSNARRAIARNARLAAHDAKLREATIELVADLARRIDSPLIIQEIDKAIVTISELRNAAAYRHGNRSSPPIG